MSWKKLMGTLGAGLNYLAILTQRYALLSYDRTFILNTWQWQHCIPQWPNASQATRQASLVQQSLTEILGCIWWLKFAISLHFAQQNQQLQIKKITMKNSWEWNSKCSISMIRQWTMWWTHETMVSLIGTSVIVLKCRVGCHHLVVSVTLDSQVIRTHCNNY